MNLIPDRKRSGDAGGRDGLSRSNWGYLGCFGLHFYLFLATQEPIPRKSLLFIRFLLKNFSSLWSRGHVFFDLRLDSSSGVAPLLESALRSKKRWHHAYAPQGRFCTILSTAVLGRSRHLFFGLRPDSSSGAVPLPESITRSNKR